MLNYSEFLYQRAVALWDDWSPDKIRLQYPPQDHSLS